LPPLLPPPFAFLPHPRPAALSPPTQVYDDGPGRLPLAPEDLAHLNRLRAATDGLCRGWLARAQALLDALSDGAAGAAAAAAAAAAVAATAGGPPGAGPGPLAAAGPAAAAQRAAAAAAAAGAGAAVRHVLVTRGGLVEAFAKLLAFGVDAFNADQVGTVW
jgi:hypothetical protein